MNSFSTRLLTAIIFVTVMLLGIFYSMGSFYILFLVIAGACSYEFLSLYINREKPSRYVYALKKLIGILMALFPFLFAYTRMRIPQVFTDENVSFFLLLPLGMLFLAFFIEVLETQPGGMKNVAFMALGSFYIGIPFSLVFPLSNLGEGFSPFIVFGIIALTWANDTGAYLAGSRWGKRLLLEKISPKKTWEGFGGGLFSSLLISLALSSVFQELPPGTWLGLAIIVSFFGPAGDLTESYMKRQCDVKDAGSLLPGHGGFLDRFDSLIFILPAASAYLWWSS